MGRKGQIEWTDGGLLFLLLQDPNGQQPTHIPALHQGNILKVYI
jgi:hypothetical protein